MSNNYQHLNEGDELTTNILKEKWLETLTFYDEMIEEGQQVRPIRNLVNYIIDLHYNQYLFPGTSLFNLLISLPINNKVSYTRTLKVEVEQEGNIVKFDYHDWTGLIHDKSEDFDKSLKWSKTCQLTETCDTFEYFNSLFEEWIAKTKQRQTE